MEPSLNPALTQQAISRVYRLGQTQPVHIHHLVMANSVEERILDVTREALSDARMIEDGTAAMSKAARASKDSAMRAADLQALFA